MVDFSRDDWRLLPRDVLDTENNQDAAQAWGDAQRKQIAQKWADAINRGIRTPGFADPNAIQSSGYNQPRAGGFVGAGAVLSSPYAQSSSQPAPPPGSAAPDTAPPALTPQDQPDSGAPPVGAPQSDSLPAPSDQSSSSAPPVTTAALSGGVPKTVSQEGGAFYGLGDREMGIARQAGDEARRRGFGDEGAKALQAILLTEGGLTGARGDQGQSAGPLQFYKGGGQLNNFARQNGMSESAAMDYVEQNPLEAIKWALGDQDKPGYLGAPLKYALSKGLTGADLATYAQKNGQVSASPERAGQWHNTLFGGGQDPFSRPITKGQAEGIGGLQSDNSAAQGPVGLGNAGLGWANQGEAGATGAGVANQKEDRGYRNQFQLGLSDGDAYAACGPAAAIAFAKANGRNPNTDEAMQLAKSVGWSQNQGMAGVASEQGLLNKMNVSTTLERDVDWNHVAKDATNGNPVIVSTPGHYFYVDDVRQGHGGNNQFHVGGSGTALKGGSEWMTADEIQQRMGKTTGALYADHPLAEGPSTTETSPTAVDKWAEIPPSGRIFPTPVTAQPGSQSGFNADTSGINTPLGGQQPPNLSAPPGVGDMQMPFAMTPPKSVHEALDQASKIVQNTPRPLAGPGGLGAYDPRLSPFNKGDTGGAGEIADLSLGGKVADVGETLGPEKAALRDEAVQIINKLDSGTGDSAPLLDRLQEIDKAFSGAPRATGSRAVITATQPASEANTVRELSVWLARKDGPPGISVESQGVLGAERPGWGKSVVFRDENGVPQGILSITNDASGKPDVAEVAVNPEFQRQGIATKLYQAAKGAGIDVDAITGQGGYTPEGAAFARSRVDRAASVASAAPGYGPTELSAGLTPGQVKGAAQPLIKTAATAFEPAANIPEAQKPAFERFAATIGPASRASKFEGEQLQRRVDKVMGDKTPHETVDAIRSFEKTGEFSANPTPEQSQLASDLRQDFEQSLQHGIDHGYGGPDVTKQPGGPNYYFPHKYVDESPPGIFTGETRPLAPGGELTQERQFKTIDEAVAAGKVPDSLSEAIKSYVINSRDNVAKTKLIDDLSQVPGSMVKLNKFGSVPEGMVPGASIDSRITSPLKDYAVDPELARSIRNVLTPSAIDANPLGRAILTATSTAKQGVFSLSNFHAMTEGLVAYYSGKGVAGADVGNNFMRAMFSPDFMEFQRSGPMADTFLRAAKAGLVGLTEKSSPDALQALLGNVPQGITGGIGGVGAGYTQTKLTGGSDEEAQANALKFGAAGAALGGLPMSFSGKNLARILSEATFERAVPMAKVTFWDGLVKSGMDEVAAAKVANQRFGGLNYDMMGRSKTLQDTLRLVGMAPDWNESTLRTIANTVMGPGKSAGVDRQFLAKAIFGTAMFTEATQYALSGHLTVDSPLGPGNERGHEGEVEVQLGNGRMIHTGIGPGNLIAYGNLINKLAQNPDKRGDELAGFAHGRLSPLASGGVDLLARDRRTSQGGLPGMAQRVAPIGVEQVAQGSQSGVSPAVTVALAVLGLNPRYSAAQKVVVPAAPKGPGAPKAPKA